MEDLVEFQEHYWQDLEEEIILLKHVSKVGRKSFVGFSALVISLKL